MDKITFIYERASTFETPKTVNTFTIEGEQTLWGLLENIEYFLKGCGYVFDGHLEFRSDPHFDDFDDSQDVFISLNEYGAAQPTETISVDLSELNLDGLGRNENYAD
jgi:hypothetical protein